MIESMRAKIADIPAEQEASWGAVVALLRFNNRPDAKMHWSAYRPREGDPFSVLELDLPGQDIDALRAEIVEAVDLVNDIVARDPLQVMTPVDAGLAEVYIK